MKRMIAILLLVVALTTSVGFMVSQVQTPQPQTTLFEKAIAVIKKYEGLHSTKHWPLVGYGHKVLPTDKFKRGKALTESEADNLLRDDLRKLCKIYSAYGRDSLILATLAYNIGIGNVAKSSVLKNIKAGNRDAVEKSYLAHCRYRGKVLSQLKRRRTEEFQTLFNAVEPQIAVADLQLTPPQVNTLPTAFTLPAMANEISELFKFDNPGQNPPLQ